MAINRTRVVRSVGDPGKWQAQFRDPETGLWFDIGDAQASKANAKSRETDYVTAQSSESDGRAAEHLCDEECGDETHPQDGSVVTDPDSLAAALVSWWRSLTPEERSLTGVEYETSDEER